MTRSEAKAFQLARYDRLSDGAIAPSRWVARRWAALRWSESLRAGLADTPENRAAFLATYCDVYQYGVNR